MTDLGPLSTQAAILGPKWAEVCTILQVNQTQGAFSSDRHPRQVTGRGDLGPARATNEGSILDASRAGVGAQRREKRNFRQAIQDAPVSQSVAPIVKRRKHEEIIELSD